MGKNIFKLLDFLKNFGKKKPTTIRLSNEKSTQLTRLLTEVMEKQRPFLNEKCNIKDLADELNIHQYQLSHFLNRKIGMKFNDYLNQHRVKYCQELIQAGVADNLNLKGLASKCGFHNRNTFTIAFKKFTGYTPSDYTRFTRRYHNLHPIGSN